MLGDAAAHDDQIGREQRLERREVPLQPLGPLLPVRSSRSRALRGGPRLGVVAVDLEVTEFRVGDEHAVEIRAVPMPVPSVVTRTRPSTPLPRRSAPRRAGGVRVVDEEDVAAQRLLERPSRPRCRSTSCRRWRRTARRRGGSTAGNVTPTGTPWSRSHRVARSPRRPRRRPRAWTAAASGCGRAPPTSSPFVEVDGRALDAGAADVDAERVLSSCVLQCRRSGQGQDLGAGFGDDAGCARTARCGCRSAVTTVQPSSHMSQSGVPSLSIGSIVNTMPGSMTRVVRRGAS